jgi:hypothetical protein
MTLLATLVARLGLGLGGAVARDVPLEAAVVAVRITSSASLSILDAKADAPRRRAGLRARSGLVADWSLYRSRSKSKKQVGSSNRGADHEARSTSVVPKSQSKIVYRASSPRASSPRAFRCLKKGIIFAPRPRRHVPGFCRVFRRYGYR